MDEDARPVSSPKRLLIRPLWLLAALLLLPVGCGEPRPGGSPIASSPEEERLLAAMLAEEDSRPEGELSALPAGLASDNPSLRRLAVRGMGRLERPDLLERIAPALADSDPAVRIAAANAVAQAVSTADSPAATDVLRGRLTLETDPAVKGALGQALGRLRPASPGAMLETERTLITLSRGASIETLLQVARGLESLARRNAAEIDLEQGSVERLVELTGYGRAGAEGFAAASDPDAVAEGLEPARVRRLALATLTAARRADAATVEAALFDPDVEVRRLAVVAVERLDDAPLQARLALASLEDEAPAVRYEALRVYGRRLQASTGCDPIFAALDDGDPHVELLAIDRLPEGCDDPAGGGEQPEVAARLTAIAESLPGLAEAPGPAATLTNREATPALTPASREERPGAAATGWQHGAHALVALAALDPAAATPLLPRFAGHPVWQVRMYTARAAQSAAATDLLAALAGDPHANVAEAALRGLEATSGEGADPAAIAALQRDDYQLLITAAGALEGGRSIGAAAPEGSGSTGVAATQGSGSAAVPALLAALDRISAAQRQTSRDARRALLERIGELGGPADAERLRPYLNDFDPRIAAQAAEVLVAWTGEPQQADLRPLPPQPLPSVAELRELAGARASIRMQGGGEIEIELFPFEAPTNVARFARQAREGYFEGLTFHRVVPNFVIQGGSPGANEYMGAGPYTRDELTARSHLRGTVGISTRGRDTGDSQLFVNLVDNVRLDHNYTIIGAITDGLDVIDTILEGATIENIAIQPAAPSR
jgi:cyclophilin family peptidyl-prolyl cis-trans isomerase/HEAT repeat protein